MPQIAPSYQSMMGQSQAIYQQTLSGYQSRLAQQQAAEAQVAAGYGTLSHNVLGTISKVGRSQRQEIQDTYAQQQGQGMQGLINAGLGNTTVQSSVSRGLTYDREKAMNALADQMAQLRAGYMSQIGLAGLGYRGQAIQADTGLAGQMLGFQGGYAGQMLGLAGSLAQRSPYGYGMGGGGTAQPMSQGPMLGQGGGYGNYQDPMLGLSALQNQAYQGMFQPVRTDPLVNMPGGYGGGQSVAGNGWDMGPSYADLGIKSGGAEGGGNDFGPVSVLY